LKHDAMTVARALHEARARLRAAGIPDAELEAELLLRHATGLTREQLFARLQEPLPAPSFRHSERSLESLLGRRLAHEPVAYITGHKEFYGLDFECAPAALIPRPETELLVELALLWAKGQGPRAMRVVDVGTGNGAIAVAIAANARAVRVLAVDVSRDALLLARRNAERHAVAARIDFVQGSLLSMLRAPVDVIVANLPYVPTRLYRKLPPEIVEHEPEVATHAGRRGTALIEALLAQACPEPARPEPSRRVEGAPALLRPGGLLVAEHQWNQGRRLRNAARAAFPGARIETKRDLSGKERALVVENA
jgi:release factor glutamine methyltransferase